MCFWLGIIGCLYVIALPDKRQQPIAEQSTKEECSDVKTTESDNQKAARIYGCKEIIVSEKKLQGNCTMCRSYHENLKECKILSDIGTREFAICDKCIRLFRDNCTQ